MMLRRLLTACSFSILVVAGCDCDSVSRLQITVPENNATLTLDADPNLLGFQTDVTISTRVLNEGETVRVYADASVIVADPRASTPYTDVADSDDEIVVRITLPAGESDIVACARDCMVRSVVTHVTVDPGACPSVTFTAPDLGTEPTIHLGPTDDLDGSPCGAEFTTAVRATVGAPDGTDVDLQVNGVSAATAKVTGGAVDFGEVVLGNRGDTANELEVVIDNGASCATPIGKPVFVDCDGSSCAITAPLPSTSFLNQSNDTDAMTAGLQVNVTVASDADTAGQTTHLIVDGDDAGALDAVAMATGSSSTSTFAAVGLPDGVRSVQAECTDASGNVTRSSVAMWTVDTTGCPVMITAPTAGQDIGTADDLDMGTSGIQILGAGTATGTDCTNARLASCSGIAGVTFGTLTANAFSLPVTLGSAPSQDICAEVRDAAGNITSAQVQVDVATTAPRVEVVSPVTNTRYNRLGNSFGMAMHVGDLNTGTDACDAAFVVNCEQVGTPVEIVSGTDVLGTASCVADMLSPFGGRATFTSVALPTASPSFTVFAQQTFAGSTGLSTPVAIMADCVAPTLAISAPTCGATLTGADDTNLAISGIQAPVTVSSPNTPQVDVRLTIISNPGGSLSYMATSTTPSGMSHVFSNASFGFSATFDVIAQATDAFGNTGTSPACQIITNDLPTLTIDTPAAGFVVNAANASSADCDTMKSGIQIAVSATTNATAGSAATIQIGTGMALTPAPAVVGGVISGCVDAPQGSSDIVVTVNDIDGGDGIFGMATALRPIVVDTLPPSGTVSPTVQILDHRIATVQLSFTAPSDGGSAFAAYHLRCAGGVIDDETKWDAATEIALTSPLAPGMAELFTLGSMSNRLFRTGVRYQCALRAADAGGNLTALPASPTLIYPAFETTLVDSGSASQLQMGYAGARPVGDVNADGRPDVLVTGRGAAFLYFGSATPPATDNPDVVFSGASPTFGVFATGIGDFDNDNIDDFAISDYNEATSRGGVYIFRGRASWPAATLSIGATGCDADLCVRGTNDFDFFGYELATVGDFDVDGDDDLGIGLSGLNQLVILSGRSLTTPTAITLADGPDGFVIQGVPTNPGSVDFAWAAIGMGNIVGSAAPDVVILAAGMNAVSFQFTVPPKLYRVAGRARTAAGLTVISGAEIAEIVTDRVLPFTMGQFVDRTSLGSADFDGDGDLDLALREPATTNLGVRVFYNNGSGDFMNASSSEITSSVGATGDFFGIITASGYHPSIPQVGDVDGDGFGDVLSGAVQAGSDTNPAAGLVYGRTAPPATIDWTASTLAAVLSPTPMPIAVSPPVTSRLVGFIGDFDGDGFRDVVVTDHRSDGANPNGRIFVLH